MNIRPKPTMKRWTGPSRGFVFPPGFMEHAKAMLAARIHAQEPSAAMLRKMMPNVARVLRNNGNKP